MDWQAEYQRKLRTPSQAAELIPDHSLIVQGSAIGEPPAMLQAVADRARAGGLTDVRMTALLPLGASARSTLQPDLRDRIHWESLFASGVDRGMIEAGQAHLVPAFFHQIPRLIEEYLDVGVAMVTVSRMDRHGYMSLGVNVDTNKAAIARANVVIAEVNNNMPRVHGNSWVHLSEVSAVIENHVPLAELPIPPEKAEDTEMGRIISEMIPNGATIQLGIGGVPNAVAKNLMGHRDLGIHTEMFVESMVDLVESGVANGTKKTFHPGKAIYTFAAGTRRMYEFLDDNPYIEAHPVSYTNHPSNIAKNDTLISVNSTIEVDLTGQCCSESMGTTQYSGTGGQHDYARGAFEARDGKSIIAFYSTAKSGSVSRVVPTLRPGAVVTTPRTEVHWLVSEYGAVCLKGKSTRERAKGIIGLAHPKFREELTASAKELGYLA